MKTLVFEDQGQDFLEWDIDDEDKVVACRPFQGFAWIGTMVLKPRCGSRPRVWTPRGRRFRLRYRITQVKRGAGQRRAR